MSPELLIINEWLLHDLRGDNGADRQKEAIRFLKKLREKPDRIAVLRGSAWMKKAYELMKYDSPEQRRLSKFLHRTILLDSSQCQVYELTQLNPLPQEVEELFEKNLADQSDRYLLEIYFSANATLLVTSDERLLKALSHIQSLNIRLRDDFLREYLS